MEDSRDHGNESDLDKNVKTRVKICETSPLLEAQSPAPSYRTASPPDNEEEWQPPRGFWWIETALWANVFLSGFDGTITASTYALIGSEFNAANDAAWLTTSYLITSTAFQPLYGRFSDIFGRRVCFLVSTATFMIGCLGCGVAQTMWSLNMMRAVTGFGGGGLITMATVVNSDMIPFRKRGMFQATQNILNGVGAVLGASLGGLVAETVGWRSCFLLQVPVSVLAIVVGNMVLKDPEDAAMELSSGSSKVRSAFALVDLSGAMLLVLGLSAQVVGLSLGGNEYEWGSFPVVSTLVTSILLLALFVVVEATTTAFPIVPLRLLHGWPPVSLQITNVFAGMAAFAYMFMIPLFFQAVRGESPSATGLRLLIPALGTPVGGYMTGMLMAKGVCLSYNVRVGTGLMVIGNGLALVMGWQESRWKEFVYLIPANVGLGLTYPSVLFSVVWLFEHREQAVATSCVYLIRSMGTIYGVTITAAVVQNILKSRLPEALGDASSPELVELIRKSVFAIGDLPPALQVVIRGVYNDALRVAFSASTAFALMAFAFSWTTTIGHSRGKK